MKWPRRATMGLIAVALIARSAPAQTEARNTSSPDASPAAVRGTERELERHGTLLQKTGCALLFVPYAGIEVVTWPIGRLFYVNERLGILPRVADVVFFSFEVGPVRLQSDVLAGGGAGSPAPGLIATWQSRGGAGTALWARGGYLSNDRNQVALGASGASGPIRLDVLAELHHREDQSFYGIGPDTPDEETTANRRRALVEGTLRTEPVRHVELGVTGFVRDTELSPPSSGDAVGDAFPELFERAEESRYVGVEGAVSFDTRNRGPFSYSGVFLRAAGGIDEARDADDESYRHYSAEAQLFVDLFRHDRVLALRVYGAGVDTDDPSSLPYTELERPGGRNGFRGYGTYRFTDRTQLLATAEYRYPVTTHVGATLFVDWGTVAPEWEKIRPSLTNPSVGFGIDVGKHRPIGVQVAYSDEGLLFYLGVESLFVPDSRRQR